MHTPTPGDIYAVFVPEAGRWRAYQFLRHTARKTGKLDSTEFLPFEGWFDSPEGIDLAALAPTIIHVPKPNSIDVRSVHGHIPPDHVLIAQHPPWTQDKATSYGGGDMNQPFWVPEAMLVEKPETYSEEIYAKDQVWDLPAFAQANPKMRSLTLRDARIRNFDALPELAQLRSLTLFDCTLDDDVLPTLAAAPRLNLLWIHNFPHASGTALKMQAKALPQLSHEITGLRKPEWYAANRDNPFAQWADPGQLPKGVGKKAIALYKDTIKRAMALTAAPKAAAMLQAHMEALARDWALAFNHLDTARQAMD